MAVHVSRRIPGGVFAPRVLVLGVVAAVAAVGTWTHQAAGSAGLVNAGLVNALLEERFTAGRLSGQSAWQACTVSDTAALVPRTVCGAPPPRSGSLRRARIDRATNALAEVDSSPAALRTRALLHLRFGGGLVERRKKAVYALEQAVQASPGDAGLLNDLAVAYLALAELEPKLDHTLRALDTVERAVAADSLHLPALFNRALILQRLYLLYSADGAWEQYILVERDPQWRNEAEQHQQHVGHIAGNSAWTELEKNPPAVMDSAAQADIRARVARNVQAAREAGFPLLGAWGSAVLDGNHARAARLLAVAREIGAAGAALGGDRSVVHAVDTIDAAAAYEPRRHTLARGHVELARGAKLYGEGEYREAKETNTAAEWLLTDGASPAAHWAAFYRAAAEVNLREYDAADSRLRRVAEAADVSEPALHGKAVWGLGLSQLRRGVYGVAGDRYREASPLIDDAQEEENQGAIAVLLAEAFALAGEPAEAQAEAFRALDVLSPHRGSRFLNHHLRIVAESAGKAGLHHAAIAVTDEAVHLARERDDANLLALVLSDRARDHAALGDWTAATRDLDEAGSWTAAFRSGSNGNRVHAIVTLRTAQVTRLRGDPATAFRLLEIALDIYITAENDLYLPQALYEAALAAQALGWHDKARERLALAIQHVERQQATFIDPSDRAPFYETVENVFDELVALELDAGNANAAFAVLERGRRPVSELGAEGIALPDLDRLGDSLPDRMMLVEYALLKDRIVILTAARGQAPRQHTVLIPRDSVARLIRGLAQDTSTADPDRASSSARLYDLLVRPLAPQLDGITQLTIVPDRELYSVPFAGLWDAPRRRYLMDSQVLRIVPSAAFYVEAARHPVRLPANPQVLVVGDPTLDPSLAYLPPLAGALGEARAVKRIYPGAALLTRDTARRDTVRERLSHASIFHFAGHAEFNAEQPGESFLALGADESESRGRMRAREIGELSLSNLQVVVLSACSTLGQRATRTGPAAGLAYSFLRADVPATVSTLWDVKDSGTTRLLERFHQELAAGTPPAQALQRAQQAVKGSLSPRAWAAFVYTGP